MQLRLCLLISIHIVHRKRFTFTIHLITYFNKILFFFICSVHYVLMYLQTLINVGKTYLLPASISLNGYRGSIIETRPPKYEAGITNTEPKFSAGRATWSRSTQTSHMRMCILAEVSEYRSSLRISCLSKFDCWSRVLRERKWGLLLGVFDDASSNL